MFNLKNRRFSTVVAASIAMVASVFFSVPSISTPQVKTSGTLYLFTHAEKFNHADPARVYTGRDIALFNSFLFRNLVAYKPVPGPDGWSLVADLATDTGVSSNAAKTWTFTLRTGITWEDGSAITCADVKYGVSRAFAKDVIADGPQYLVNALDIPKDLEGGSAYKGPYTKIGQEYFDKAVTCVGNTITFNLNRPFGDFNYALTYPAAGPVKASKDTGDSYDLHPFASGPYKIEVYKIGDEMRLVRNTAWDQSSDPIRMPHPNDIVVRFGLAQDVIDEILLSDSVPNVVNLDGLQPVNKRAFFANAGKETQRLNVFDSYVHYAAMNVAKGHMDCLDVRKAVFFAINTQALIDLSGGSVFYGEPGDSPVNPLLRLDYKKTTGNIHDPAWKITGNPGKAAAFLASAKISCPDAYDRATNPTKGIIWDISSNSTSRKVAVLVTDALKAAGINVKFNLIPEAQYYPTVQNHAKQNDISSAGWGPDWSNALTIIPELFTKEGGFNLSQNWNDPTYAAFKAKSDQAIIEINRATQAKMWQELSQHVMDQYWIINTRFGKSQPVWGSQVGGVYYWEPQGTFGFGQLYIKQ